MVDLKITVDILSKGISSLESSVSDSPDQIQALFLRKITTSLALPLQLLFNMTLKQEKVPQTWKKIITTRFHKKVSRKTALYYRSVSLTTFVWRTQQHTIHTI